MDIPIEVALTYLALAVWAGTLVLGVRRRTYRPFLFTGIGIMLFLNLRYLVAGSESGIANFVALYDFFDNLGLDRSDGAPALAACADNACSIWDRYTYHPSWGVAFFERFANGPASRNTLLYSHIAFNTIAFVLMHVQLFRPGGRSARHATIGRVTFAALTLGTICAVWLASEHGAVPEYGGLWAEIGFYSMTAVVYGAAVASVVAIRRGDREAHRIWSIRFVGSMWGAFWLFRVMLVFTGPLLRNWESLSLNLSIWLSAPLGLLIADAVRRRATRSLSAAGPENRRSAVLSASNS